MNPTCAPTVRPSRGKGPRTNRQAKKLAKRRAELHPNDPRAFGR